jgi:hypothetical protein
MKYVATIDEPVEPTAENYRFDLSYSSTASGICEVQYFDKDKDDWSALAGTPADSYLLGLIEQEQEFRGQQFVYYTMMVQDDTPVYIPSEVIDVTPIKGEQDVPKLTSGL